MTALTHLFQPIKIGSLELPNRIVMAPMTVDYANDDETPSERHIAYYAERAKGGVGLITMEVCTVDAEHRYQAHSLGLYADHLIEPHKKIGGCRTRARRKNISANFTHRTRVAVDFLSRHSRCWPFGSAHTHHHASVS